MRQRLPYPEDHLPDRREHGQAASRYPQGYRQEPPRRRPPPALALEDVMDELGDVQATIVQMAAQQPRKEEFLALFREMETAVKQHMANYYPADVVDAKIAERAQIAQALRDQVAQLQHDFEVTRNVTQQDVIALKATVWTNAQKRVIMWSCATIAGVFSCALLIQIIGALAKAVIH